MFSVGNENSDVTKINENGSGEVSEETAFIMNRAMQVSKETKGAFDITIYPVMELWGFTTKNYRVPEHSEIAEVLKHVSYTNVGINGQQVTLSDGASIDLGGIAKGYTSSRVIQIMKDCGIEHAIINLGGNVQVLGRKSDGSDWRVAIQNPDSESSYLGVLSTADKAVITSGGYERYFEQDGQVYHHIIDPQTGYPSESDLTSVTIVCSDGTTADALNEATEHLMAAINALVKVDADTPSGSEEPDNTDDSSVEDVPTGDANNMMAYLAATVLALTAGVAVTCRRKIKNVR